MPGNTLALRLQGKFQSDVPSGPGGLDIYLRHASEIDAPPEEMDGFHSQRILTDRSGVVHDDEWEFLRIIVALMEDPGVNPFHGVSFLI